MVGASEAAEECCTGFCPPLNVGVLVAACEHPVLDVSRLSFKRHCPCVATWDCPSPPACASSAASSGLATWSAQRWMSTSPRGLCSGGLSRWHRLQQQAAEQLRWQGSRRHTMHRLIATVCIQAHCACVRFSPSQQPTCIMPSTHPAIPKVSKGTGGRAEILSLSLGRWPAGAAWTHHGEHCRWAGSYRQHPQESQCRCAGQRGRHGWLPPARPPHSTSAR